MMDSKKNTKPIVLPLFLLAASALAIRIIAFNNTLMMNNDGPVYIHQARALYHGFWNAITSCTIDYPTLYTALIAAVYPMTGDWVHAAMAVNMIFGTLVIIPLYLFLRRFLNEEASFLTTFIFAMLPVFVIQSVNIIRDPSYWFFSMLGLYLLVYDDDSKTPYALSFSGFSFLIATATRIEGIAFIIGGCVYALLVFKNRRFKAITFFLLPLILAVSGFVIIQLIRQREIFYWQRIQESFHIIKIACAKYLHLKKKITLLIANVPYDILKDFLKHSGSLAWFIALGVILSSAVEAFFYIFFVLFLFGFAGLKNRMQNDSRITPLLLIAVISLILVYFYCLYIWSMENRRLAAVILSTAFITGFGAENLLQWLKKKFGLSNLTSVAILCVLVLVVTLPKNLKIQEEDKLVFKEIGEHIAKLDGRMGEIELITLGGAGRWIDYYANLHVDEPPCPDKYRDKQKQNDIIGENYESFINNLKAHKINYIIWEEQNWPGSKFNFLKSVRSDDLKYLKEWQHPDAGKIILYQVLQQKKG